MPPHGPVSIRWHEAQHFEFEPAAAGKPGEPFTIRLRVDPRPDNRWWELLEEFSRTHAKPWSARKLDSFQIALSGVTAENLGAAKAWLNRLAADANDHFARGMVEAGEKEREEAEAMSRREEEAREIIERLRQPPAE
jgi:hypothetical protein